MARQRWLRWRRLWLMPEWGLDQLGWRRGDVQGLPWPTNAGIGFIDQVAPNEWQVLEIGGGSSTGWWLARGNRVLCLEGDPTWARRIRKEDPAAEVLDVASAQEVREWLERRTSEGMKFPVVVVDGIQPREQYLASAAGVVAEGGLLVVDNSDWSAYSAEIATLEADGWLRFDFFGLGPSNPYAWMTSVLSRASISHNGRRGFPNWKLSEW